jgi:hypothetical protein
MVFGAVAMSKCSLRHRRTQRCSNEVFIVCGADERNVAQTKFSLFHRGNTSEKQTRVSDIYMDILNMSLLRYNADLLRGF